MNFNSFHYILIFLPAVLLACQFSRRVPKGPQICVLVASLIFYAWGKPSHLAYLVGSILVNWQIAQRIGQAAHENKKRYVQLGLVLNIGFLCLFKYVNFFFKSIPTFAHHHVLLPELDFPLGISFFTLTQVMYLVDCYEGLNGPSTLFDHATFVSFFPYVISGPIARAKRIVHQFTALNSRVGPTAEMVSRAMYLFSLGLMKKIVLADAFSKGADYGFNSAINMSALEAWIFASCYALQIYFDFSGYSDMAIASALMLGIEIPRNFDAPLRSTSIIEFWQRWHISLSQFITTYLYTPILKSFERATLTTASIATLLAMTIAGLWHGPSWNFVLFGVIHGLGLVVNQYWRKKKKKLPVLPDFVCWVLTFALVDFAFVFFRSPNLPAALVYVRHLFNWPHPFSITNVRAMNGAGLMVAVFVLAQVSGVVAAFFGKSSEQMARDFAPTWMNYAATVGLTAIAWLFLNSSISKPFVYFAF
jgi:alginate O-acetyltransferase complex protein AlgI